MGLCLERQSDMKKNLWLNIYKNDNNYSPGIAFYKTKKEAKLMTAGCANYVITLPIIIFKKKKLGHKESPVIK